jgi:AcrR family transcriptional regulator
MTSLAPLAASKAVMTTPSSIQLKKRRRPVDTSLRERRREQILVAATQLFAGEGYSDADTQVLADRLRVGKGTLYRYFRTKRELFLAAADRVMRELRRAVDSAMEGVADPLEGIARAVRAYLDFFALHPEFVELLMQERAQFKDRKKPTYFEHRDLNVERWRDMYRSLIAQGRIRDIPVDRITDVFGNLLYGTISTNYFAGQQKPSEVQAQDILDVVFHGILGHSK